MADVTITIPDQHVTRVIDALAKVLSCQATAPAVKQAFAQRLRDWVKWAERDAALLTDAEEFDANWDDPGIT